MFKNKNRLSNIDIQLCLKDQENFLRDYIYATARVCWQKKQQKHRTGLNTPPGNTGETKPSIDQFSVALNNEKVIEYLIGNIEPSRDMFFHILSLSDWMEFDNILEIGVADGTNAKRMYEKLKPKKMWLIDPWEPQENRAADRGHNTIKHQEAYTQVKNIFAKEIEEEKVHILKGYSHEFLNEFEDGFFDLMYIDGDHSYEGCREDLFSWYPKLKDKGWLAGHDFTNTDSSMRKKGYGVQKAATEFLKYHDLKIEVLTPCIETRYPYTLLPFDWGIIK